MVSRHQVERLRSKVGMVFQNFNLWSHLTVLQNIIEAPVHVQKRRRGECVAEAEALLRRVGIEEKRDCYPSQLSGWSTAAGSYRPGAGLAPAHPAVR